MIASHIDTVATGEWVEDRVVVRIHTPGILLPDHEFGAGEKAPIEARKGDVPEMAS